MIARFPPQPMLPTVLLVWRTSDGGAHITETSVNSTASSDDPIAEAIGDYMALPGCATVGANAWSLEKAILLDPVTCAARDVTAAFLSRLHDQAVEACGGDENELNGWIWQVDELCQSHGFEPVVTAWGPRERPYSPLTYADVKG